MLVLMLQHVSSRVSGFPVASPCLWEKLQNLSFSKVPKAGCHVVFCGRRATLWHSNLCYTVPKVVLCGRHNTFASFSQDKLQFSWQAQHFKNVALRALGSSLPTLHFTLHTLHSTLYTLHFTLYTLHSTLYTPHSTLHTPHFTLHTPHSTLYSPHSTLYALHCTLHTLHSTLYTPHSTLYTPHFTLYTLHFTLYTLHFTLHTPHSTLHTLHSTLHTSQSTLHTLHFTLHTPHSTLYTLHFTLYTLHSTLYTLHSIYILHSTLYTLHSTLHTLHSTLHTLHFTLYTLHSTLYTLHFTLYTLHFTLSSTLHTLHFTLRTPHFTLHTPHFALDPLPHSTVHSALVRQQGINVDCSINLLHKSVLRVCIQVRGLHLVTAAGLTVSSILAEPWFHLEIPVNVPKPSKSNSFYTNHWDVYWVYHLPVPVLSPSAGMPQPLPVWIFVAIDQKMIISSIPEDIPGNVEKK